MPRSASTRPAPPADRKPRAGTRGWARWMFYAHLWLGVVTTGIVLIICITGVLLNHKRPLGLMPDVPNESPGALSRSLPVAELAARAERAVRPEVAATGIDRMDLRPGDGLVKVRFDDREVHEVTVDLASGRILHVGLRNDVFLEKLHSGEIFGDGWTLLSDVAAIALAILLVSGLWLWLYPRARA
ncbi:MAG TPA: PepSY-associated TM helix domain-containing protein [Longimicrobium sp.]|uniref:PepSY-associated TM helix domain-containing protein n=1 Tax=Longimicrobium sp. TaxID=2029185 RepID=UPI002ED7FA4D